MTLSRKTRDRLWRELLERSAAPRDVHASLRWPLTVLLTVLALYLFAKL